MKKTIKYSSIFLFLLGITFYFTLYPKFDIVAGFSAKSIASHYFLAGRSQEFTQKKDNAINSMNLASNILSKETNSVSSSVKGLKKRTAQYFDGLGVILIPQGKEFVKIKRAVPKRNKIVKPLAFPYGNLPQKDTVFSNIDYKKLNDAIQNAFDINRATGDYTTTKKTRSVLVIYKDQIVGEQYAKNFNKDSKMLGWSMAKSITSGVLGVLEKQGKITLEQDHLFSEWENDKRKNITLQNLLNMNSGLEWKEDYTKICDVTQMLFLDSDMSQKQKNKPFAGKPNETWNYSSGTTNLLSGFIRNQFASQQNYLDFWYAALIDKIGMHSMVVETDFSGHFVGSSYAWATTRDWAKFGLLYLHNGNWNGEQLINKSWVDFTRKPTNTSNQEYGGHFWLNAGGVYADVPRDLYSCNGYQGQHVFIIPSKDLVVVRFGLAEHPEFDMNLFLKEILDSIK